MIAMSGRLRIGATPNGHGGLWFQRILFLLSASLPPPVAEMEIGKLISAVQLTPLRGGPLKLGLRTRADSAESKADARDFQHVGDLDMSGTRSCSTKLFCGDGCSN